MISNSSNFFTMSDLFLYLNFSDVYYYVSCIIIIFCSSPQDTESTAAKNETVRTTPVLVFKFHCFSFHEKIFREILYTYVYPRR